MSVPVFDVASSSVGVAVAGLTWSHTCTGANGCLTVGVGSGAVTPHATSTVTYNSEALTELHDGVTVNAHASGHYLVAPATGSALSIVVTLSGTDDEVICGAASYTSVDQSTPVGTPNSDGNTTTTATVTIAAVVGDLVVDQMYYANWGLGDPHAAGAGQTERVNRTDSGDGTGFLGLSEEAGAASVVMSWSVAAGSWRAGGVSLVGFVDTSTSPRLETVGNRLPGCRSRRNSQVDSPGGFF